ncbi:MAG: hypothetical protein ACEY3M_08155 [Wolbachia sp.]
MTVRGGMTISSSSRYLLAGSMLRDTANESRYDVGLLRLKRQHEVSQLWKFHV